MIRLTIEKLELDFQRLDFENEWQDAWAKEELTNAIIYGIRPAKGTWIHFGKYDIKNQARTFGDLNYVKQWKND